MERGYKNNLCEKTAARRKQREHRIDAFARGAHTARDNPLRQKKKRKHVSRSDSTGTGSVASRVVDERRLRWRRGAARG